MSKTYVNYIVITKSITRRVMIRWINSEVKLVPKISVDIMKGIDERERCDTTCVIMRWSNRKV